MQLIDARDETRLDAIRKLYFQAFPAAERKPFSLLLKKRDEGRAEILSLEEAGSFSGLAVTVFSGDLALLDYFAISPALRGQGAGGKALGMLRERYAGKRLFLEIEDPFVPNDNPEQRQKRRAFYLRAGMTPLPFRVNLFGVQMELLSFGAPLTYEEYAGLYADAFGNKILAHISLATAG